MDSYDTSSAKNSIKHEQVFNKIAPFYGLFYNLQNRNYIKSIEKADEYLNFTRYKNIIDIGCGTGALCNVLNQKGLDVTGVDPVDKMLAIARKKNKDNNIKFTKANIVDGLPFKNNTFDLSIASYVAHGLKAEERLIMYKEMQRITNYLVIIYDYNEKRSFITDMAEWLEGGDYFNFVKNIKTELTNFFGDVKVLDIGKRASIYINSVNNSKSLDNGQY